MKKIIILFVIFTISHSSLIVASEKANQKEESMQSEQTPAVLWKIVSLENWNASQNKKTLVLSSDDDAFIHLSKDNQYPKVLEKYWPGKECVLLLVKTSELIGRLVFEPNRPGGESYYHLYEGSIPLTAITQASFVKATHL